MKCLSVFLLITTGIYCNPTSRVVEQNNVVSDGSLRDTELLLTFVVFRHGDRTPDHEELSLFPAADKDDIFFPYGLKALTNKGKQRGFCVGKYLRQRYDGFLSRLYLQDEIKIRTTNYDRTKMTGLTALAGLYPPEPAQRWNPFLNWQPIPYDTPPADKDDMLYYYNCPRYIALRDQEAKTPKTLKKVAPYQELFPYLQEHTKTNITSPVDVFYLDNLFQTLNNVGVKTPEWAKEVMPQIKELTKIEYGIEFGTTEMIQLAGGILLSSIINSTKSYMDGETEQPKARLYSAHENNVAAIMAATRVFIPHQPQYGSTISIEFRKHKQSEKYGFTAVYAKEAGGPGKILSVDGCGGGAFCEYDKFVDLVKEYTITEEEYKAICPVLP